MNPNEDEAVAALKRFAVMLGVRLPCDVPLLLGAALQWSGCNPRYNALAPGFLPLEHSFSTWQPEEFRTAAQLFAALAVSERRARTIALARHLAERYLPACPALHDLGVPPSVPPKRFGAFFGITAGPGGLTGVEAYLEAGKSDERISWLPGSLLKAPELSVRSAFTGIGIRDGMVRRRAYLAVTRDPETTILRRVLRTCTGPAQVGSMLASLNDLVSGRYVLPAGTVMVTVAEDSSVWSVELHAASYGVDVISLPDRLWSLRNAAFGRWVTAVGGRHAATTVVSIRFSERFGPGIAVYAVPAWARELPALISGRPMACPPATG